MDEVYRPLDGIQQMIRGHRWVETGEQYFQLEDGKPGSRHFVGAAFAADGLPDSKDWRWYVPSSVPNLQGETTTKRLAQNEVEMYIRGRIRALKALDQAREEANRAVAECRSAIR